MNTRKSNIELLRIVAMIMIIGHHLAIHSHFPEDMILINNLWIKFIQMGGKIGVNIFILISGYFLVTNPTIRVEKILKLWLEVIVYSVVFLFCNYFYVGKISPSDILIHVLPISFSEWWFISTYFVLYLCSPLLNIMLKSLVKETYLKMLLLFGVLWIIFPSVLKQSMQSNSLIWFIYVYSTGGYIRLHGKEINYLKNNFLGYSMVGMLLAFMAVVSLDILENRGYSIGFGINDIYAAQSLPIVLTSLFLFLGFLKLSIPYSRTINSIASTTFGIYLLHDNSFSQNFLWNGLFNCSRGAYSVWFIPYTLLMIFLVFCLCCLIDLTRIHFVENKLSTMIDKLANRISKRINS